MSQQFLTSIQSCSLLPTITKPTRITDNTATLIDNIFTMSPIDLYFGILISVISDHFPIFLIRGKLFSNQVRNNTNVKYSLLNENTLTNFYNALTDFDFTHIINNNDHNVALQSLIDVVDNTYNTFCPIKSKYISYKTNKNHELHETLLLI